MKKAKSLSPGEIATLITGIENRNPRALKSLSHVFNAQSLRKTVCFTGPAGVGKSTLLSHLIPLAAKSQRVAWVACDPSSAKSGGALLGDRIRLQGSDLSENIFVRSMSTRSTQAFSQSIRDVEILLESHFDQVWVETAGTGQTQSEVAQISALTVLILQPETGDEIQWMKSGLREWADIFVIHKADLSGADQMEQSLIEFGASAESIVKVSSQQGRGFEKVLGLIESAQKNLNWPPRRQALHGRVAEQLFYERALEKLKKDFQKKRSRLLKRPYG